jgi:hypothetical protein
MGQKTKKNVPTDVLKRESKQKTLKMWVNGMIMQGKQSCRVVSGIQVSGLSN